MKKALTVAAFALVVATSVQAKPPVLYIEGALGIDKQEGYGFFGQRTLGEFSVGAEHQGLFMEYRHQSNVQLRDENGGDDAIWVGFRKEFQL